MSIFLENTLFYLLVFFAFVSSLSIAGHNIVSSLALLIALLKIIIDRKVPQFKRFNLNAILIFFVILLLTIPFSTNIHQSTKIFSKHLNHIIIFFIAIFYIKSIDQVKKIINFLFISISIASIYAIYQWMNGMDRVEGFFSHPMNFAGCLILVISVILIQLIQTKTTQERVLISLTLCLALIALVLNQTRGAWIAVAFIPFILLLFTQKRKEVLIFTILFLVGVSLIFQFYTPLKDRLESIFDLKVQSNSERLLLWQSAIKMFMDHPFTGVGLGNFEEQNLKKYVSPLAKEPDLPHAHNNLLNFLAETGIFGFLAFSYLFYRLFRVHLKFSNHLNPMIKNFAIMAILFTTTFFVQGFTQYTFGDSVVVRFFWFLTGITFAIYRIQAETEPDNESIIIG